MPLTSRKVSLRISSVYFLIAGLWILFSDRVLLWIVSDPRQAAAFQTYKGFAFVVVTTLLLYQTLFSQLRHLGWLHTTLTESERRLQTLTSNLPGIAYRCQNDPDWTMTYVSRGSRELTGYDPEQLILNKEVSYAELIHPDDRDQVWKGVQTALSKKQPYELTYRIRSSEGVEKHVWEQGIAVFSREGEVEGLEGFITDISERVHAEQLLQKINRRLNAIIQSSPMAIYDIGRTGCVRSVWNPAAESIFGWKADEVLGKSLPTIPEGRAKEFEELLSQAWEGEVLKEIETERRRKDGALVDVGISAGPLRDDEGNVEGMMVTLADISERVEAKARLQSQIDRLRALRSIDLAITSSLDQRVTFEVLLDQVTSQLMVDAADILLYDPHSRMLNFSAGRGFRTDALRHTHLSLGQGYAGQAALDRRIVPVPDLTAVESDFARSPQLEDEDFIAYFAIPLLAKGTVQGVLEIFSRSSIQISEEWMEFLEALAGQAAIAIDNSKMYEGLIKSNMELSQAYDTTLEGWSRALELRDVETEGHSRRVTETTLRLAREMGMKDEELVHVRRGALLHDIGKMGIPDSILLKPGKLTDEEWEIMRRHPTIAYELLSPIDFLRPALDIPYCHHEKWDGSGYPRGLKGEQIPLAPRIFAVIDVWDALTSDRPYRGPWPREKVRSYIQEESETHFDPKVVDRFLRVLNELL